LRNRPTENDTVSKMHSPGTSASASLASMAVPLGVRQFERSVNLALLNSHVSFSPQGLVRYRYSTYESLRRWRSAAC
jgi:hypothetical protein